MAGFSGKVRKPKAAAKLGKRVSKKVAPQPAVSELSDDSDAEDFGGDDGDMDEEVVGACPALPGVEYSFLSQSRLRLATDPASHPGFRGFPGLLLSCGYNHT
jgi:hypothetical protein